MPGVLILGRDGQVGSALAALDWRGMPATALSRVEADITSGKVEQAIARLRPAVVINSAAYTNVEGAEQDHEKAFAVNALAPGRLAQACAAGGAWLIHYSTDYVFDGGKPGAYIETDAPAPLNVYGQSKLVGEQAIAASGCRHLILRTSWVYSRAGENFVTKILARARAGTPLQVVDDQFGAPTWAHALALATRRAVAVLADPDTAQQEGTREQAPGGIYHLSAAGCASWHEVALAALELGGIDVPVTPVPSSRFATAARRPRNSQLDSSRFEAAFGHRIGAWREDLRRCLRG